MNIAIPCQEGLIPRHLEDSPAFCLYRIEGDRILDHTILPSPAHGAKALAHWLHTMQTEILICDELEEETRRELDRHKIRICAAVKDPVELAVTSLLRATLEFAPAGLPGRRNHKGDHHTANSSCDE